MMICVCPWQRITVLKPHGSGTSDETFSIAEEHDCFFWTPEYK